MNIHVLPPDVYMKISAGEVVSGPFSGVKELVENSIDSGSKNICVSFKKGGLDSFSVLDDGFGMTPEEMKLAVLPHSTSKINDWEDLLTIGTFGFRGEALASISSVSETYIFSKTETAETGIRIFWRGGIPIEEKKVPMNRGTEVEVRNLFFNVPARRKFLKSSSYEGRKIIEVCESFILSNPEISFLIKKDGTEFVSFKAQLFVERIRSFFKGIPKESIVFFENRIEPFKLKGVFALPGFDRPNRSGIYIFVNKRYIKNSLVFSAIDSGFEKVFDRKRFPVIVLFIDVPSDQVDVNIHPQKLEVKFSNSEAVFAMINRGIKEALGEKSFIIPNKVFSEKNEISNLTEKTSSENRFFQAKNIPSKIDSIEKAFDTFKIIESFSYSDKQKEENTDINSSLNETPPAHDKFMFLGIAGKRYLLFEIDDGIELVDFHAAHERILFDDLKGGKRKINSQNILIPQELHLDKISKEVIVEQKSQINKLGFYFELLEDSVSISAAPDLIRPSDVKQVFSELLEDFRIAEIEGEKKVFDRAFSTIACHIAFRTGEMMGESEASEIYRILIERKIFFVPMEDR